MKTAIILLLVLSRCVPETIFMETCDAVQTDSLFADPWCSSTVGNCNRFGQSGGFTQDGAIFQSGTLVLGIAIIHSNRF